MNRARSMRRRAFLGIAGGGVASVCGARPAGAVPVAPAVLRDAIALGQALRAQRLVEADPQVLRQALNAGGEDIRDLLTRNWRAEMQRDFAAGQTVYVAGWTLSLTEARLCALAADARSRGQC
ncbi:hypothetical protein [Limimaricola sp.]|uniref:hypothetical protein n=1 Tax=Limimaricola sp. TaxID=2211665 RepID=UPI0040597043